MHRYVGHEFFPEIQDLIELDDEYDPNILEDADRKFITDGGPEYVTRRLVELFGDSA